MSNRAAEQMREHFREYEDEEDAESLIDTLDEALATERRAGHGKGWREAMAQASAMLNGEIDAAAKR